jgi:SNF2 family DNA or RNA helicase
MEINLFKQRFKSLSPAEQSLLKLLAVAYETLSSATILQLLKETSVFTSKGLPFQQKDLDYTCELLDAADWLRYSPDQGIGISEKYRELTMRMAVADPDFARIARLLHQLRPYKSFGRAPESFQTCLRELRVSLFEGNKMKMLKLLDEIKRFFSREWKEADFFKQVFLPFDPDWLSSLLEETQDLILQVLMNESLAELQPIDACLQYIRQYRPLTGETDEELRWLFYLLPAIVRGEFQVKRRLVNPLPALEAYPDAAACFAFFGGRNREALEYFNAKLKADKASSRLQPKFACRGFSPVLHALALLKEHDAESLSTLRQLLEGSTNADYPNIWMALQYTLYSLLNLRELAAGKAQFIASDGLDWIICGAVRYWFNLPLSEIELDELKEIHFKATRNGYRWVALEMARLISEFEQDPQRAASYAETAAKLEKETGVHSILHIIQRREGWERALEALLQLPKEKTGTRTSQEKNTRLAWLVDFTGQNPMVQPVEQTLGKSGWSKGRNVSLKRIKEGQVECMSPQDLNTVASIKAEFAGSYYGQVDFKFDFEQLLPALVGHPLLFLMENPAVSVELEEAKPQLLVEQKDGQFLMHFSHPFSAAGIQLIKETPTRYLLLNINSQQAAINSMLEKGQLLIPEQAKDKLLAVIENLAPVVSIQADIWGDTLSVPTIEGNPLPHVHLLPSGNGFKVEFFVKPFSSDPPYFKPGKGRVSVMAEIKGQSLRAQRNLQLEHQLAQQVEAACPTLQKIPGEHHEWLLDQLDDSLSALLELEPLRKQGTVVLEYPRGEKLRIAGTVNFGQLSLGIRRERDWFSLDGQVRVDEHQVLDFRELFEKSQQTDSRFVEISEGRFIALTNQLKRKLDELGNVFTTSKTDIRLHPLAAHVFDDFAGQLQDLAVDKAWKAHIAKIEESRSLQTAVPSTLKTELRPYQVQGFQWLAQLANWGVGACLADDMGLGKTVQTLALLLSRAADGPAMVVAPASVVRNWYHEALKFAPTLRPVVFSEGDRREIVQTLQPFDLLLVSYGLLQQESELLAGQLFSTIVLDEAQAIKNRATKRSQAAMKLQAGFKMITTGTPLENHLGELWNLFHFLNPGLLGSLDRFNEHFAVPIERNQDREKRQQLRHLLQPFLLRRRKSDVLDELPPKTEIVLSVELSAEERSFYEALRRQALSNIESTTGNATDKRFKILAELMRLRQAACHPRLIQPDSRLPSSKLNLLTETIQDLREEGHKALIFSQFVKHLAIVEEWVKEQGIPYQYLDGSTPLPQRDKAIRAFQSGEGDLFLISLKAGGFGLNLTAADYVIHLDPWWNPAVEDQASDRAHRIGQLRPVTIYRLVSENTIEDKIVRLHGEKRELADSLLEGTEVSGKMSAEELLDLMRS